MHMMYMIRYSVRFVALFIVERDHFNNIHVSGINLSEIDDRFDVALVSLSYYCTVNYIDVVS